MVTLGAFEIVLAIFITIIYAIITLLIHKYCTNQDGIPYIHQSSVAALIGLAMGGIINQIIHETFEFNNDIFFYMILPSIIFSAGYSMKKRKFFRFIHHIALYGIIGTLINFALITSSAYLYPIMFPTMGIPRQSWLEAMVLSSVLAASDEVSAIALIKMEEFPRLGALIFGEGVLNDALSIVLFKSLYTTYSSDSINKQIYISSLLMAVLFQILASCLIGLICGLLNARFLKVFKLSRKHPVNQITLVIFTAFFAYSIAEVNGISGILTLFVTALTLAHYSWHSLSKTAKITSFYGSNALSEAAEGFAFAYVGLSLWNTSSGSINFCFGIYMLFVIILSRFITILSLGVISTCVFKGKGIPIYEQISFALGGVVRGCLCWAQILQIYNNELFIQTTVIIIMTTTVLSGIILPQIIPRLTSKTSKTASNSPTIELTNILTSNSNKSGGINKNSTPVKTKKILEVASPYPDVDGSMSDADEDNESYHSPISSPIKNHNIKSDSNAYHRLTIDNDISTHPIINHNTNKFNIQKYSYLYILWIRFDECIMKPYFGGSTTAPYRLRILQSTIKLKTMSLIANRSVEIDTLGIDEGMEPSDMMEHIHALHENEIENEYDHHNNNDQSIHNSLYYQSYPLRSNVNQHLQFE